MSEYFSPDLFRKAESEGINLYAKMDIKKYYLDSESNRLSNNNNHNGPGLSGLNSKNKANPMQRWSFQPHVKLRWNYDCTKLHYQAPKSDKQLRRGGPGPSPPLPSMIERRAINPHPRSRTPQFPQKRYYTPWYNRDNVRSGTRRLSTAPAKVEPYRLKYSSFNPSGTGENHNYGQW